jgi:hypothetical protein
MSAGPGGVKAAAGPISGDASARYAAARARLELATAHDPPVGERRRSVKAFLAAATIASLLGSLLAPADGQAQQAGAARATEVTFESGKLYVGAHIWSTEIFSFLRGSMSR